MPELKTMEQIKEICKKLKNIYADRDALYGKIEDMYLLKDSDLPSDDDITQVISPDARNKVGGMVRLLTATEPKWSIPQDKNDADNMESSSRIEKAATSMWIQAGRVKGRPIEKDVVLTAGLYSMVSVAVKMTDDIVKTAMDEIQKKRAQMAYARTPLLFTTLNPGSCYPLFDDLGLAAHYYQRDLSVADIIAKHGEAAAALLAGETDTTKTIEYNEYWDWQQHAVWVEAGDILPGVEHKLTHIPIACKIVEGSDIFETKDSIQPFLYGLEKSGVWKAQNKALTAMFTNTFTVAIMPKGIYHANQEGKTAPQADYSVRGGILTVGPNEDITPYQRQAIDPALQTTYELSRTMVEESTIYSQTLGQPLGGNAAYSMIALLSEAGRLPLVPYQEMCSEVIGEAMQIGMIMLRDTGGKAVKVPAYNKVKGKSTRAPGTQEFDPKEYRDDMELQAVLDISMPQDQMSNARVATELTNARMMPKQMAMERYLNIGQPDEAIKQIWSEDYSEAMAQMKLQSWMQQQQAQMQGQMQQGAPAQGMPQEAQQGMPPEAMMQQQGTPAEVLPQQGAQPGMPMTEPMPTQQQGIPPEMMGGGM